MKKLRKELLILLALLLAAVSLHAETRTVIVVADLDHGVALVPDGVEFPKGIAIRGRDQQPLVFAHAPDAAFDRARQAIAENAPWGGRAPSFVAYQKDRAPVSSSKGLRIVTNVDNSDTWTYVYFWDGSWVGSHRIVHDYGGAGIYYGVQTATYTPENDWYSGTLYSQQSSTDKPGFNTSATCSVNYLGGSCYTGTYAYQWTDPFSAHVTSFGNIHHHRLPICGRYGEPPCEENFSASIEVYFP